MAEIKDFDDQLRDITAEIRKMIDVEIPKLKGKAKLDVRVEVYRNLRNATLPRTGSTDQSNF